MSKQGGGKLMSASQERHCGAGRSGLVASEAKACLGEWALQDSWGHGWCTQNADGGSAQSGVICTLGWGPATPRMQLRWPHAAVYSVKALPAKITRSENTRTLRGGAPLETGELLFC